ncbi:hypothetical protein FDECE_18481 [Fusarium decemcellulare]|nr:hypothetical protein FDECE_18481 [Fusarium decemcellulare]
MRGFCACRVLASRSKSATKGDIVSALAGWTEYAILREDQFEPASYFPNLRNPYDMLSAFGMTGLAAWVGIMHLAQPQLGETVVISGAAGATGSIAGQIAKIRGARVIGICGTGAKCKWLIDELDFDVALNYRDSNFKERFESATHDSIDVYFDNEIEEYTERIPISHSGGRDPRPSPNPGQTSRACLGFDVTDYKDLWPQARSDISRWLADGKLKKREHILKGGLKMAEQGLIDLFNGINTGKLLVEIKSPLELHVNKKLA